MHLKPVLSADSDLFTTSRYRRTATVTRLVAAAAEPGWICSNVDAGDLIRALAVVCMTRAMSLSHEQPCRISKLPMEATRYGASAT